MTTIFTTANAVRQTRTKSVYYSSMKNKMSFFQYVSTAPGPLLLRTHAPSTVYTLSATLCTPHNPDSQESTCRSSIPALVKPTTIPRPHSRVESHALVRPHLPSAAAARVAADIVGPACTTARRLVAGHPERRERTCWATGKGGRVKS